ncbi:MAG: DUF4272 domain-containing protein [Candidatus Kapaibacterium sp.]
MKPSSKDVYRRLMVLKYVISHSYRNVPVDVMKQNTVNWTVADKEDYENVLQKNMEETVSSIKDFGLWKYTTQSEKDFLSTYGSNIDGTSQMNATWRMEAAVVLMWALNIENHFPDLNEQANPERLQKIPIKRIGLFFSDLKLRPYNEISKMRDIIEAWHWRVNTRRLIQNNYKFEPDENMKKAGINSLDDIVKMAAKSAYENGDIKEIMDQDFVLKGIPFRDLGADDFLEATSIIIERHFALNWLCGFARNNNWDETPTDT